MGCGHSDSINVFIPVRRNINHINETGIDEVRELNTLIENTKNPLNPNALNNDTNNNIERKENSIKELIKEIKQENRKKRDIRCISHDVCSLKWNSKIQKCNKCNMVSKYGGVKCNNCELYCLCVYCSDFKFPLSMCPNNHELDYSENEENLACTRCYKKNNFLFECTTCNYHLCLSKIRGIYDLGCKNVANITEKSIGKRWIKKQDLENSDEGMSILDGYDKNGEHGEILNLYENYILNPHISKIL